MKKFLKIIILSYLLITLNTNANSQNLNESTDESNNILKIGVLVPLSGKFKQIGKSVLQAIQLAVVDLNKPNVIIFPKDSKGNSNDTYFAAKEFEKLGINIVIGPIFYENLKKINKINNITFISLTNTNQNLPNEIIAFGINFESQLEAITQYLIKKKIEKTILLLPESEFGLQIEPIIQNHKFKFYKTYHYNTSAEKITAEIEKITNYKQRKINLNARVKILEKSDLEKDKRELEKLKEQYTLGKVDFTSVVIADFGERLKSVLASFTFADITHEKIKFFTLNHWFDESLFNEESSQNLFFPGIDLENFNKFRKRYYQKFNEPATEISILAYDALGLIYFLWNENKFNIKTEKFFLKDGFKGLQGEFKIKNNSSYQKLEMYKISEKKFVIAD